MVALYAMTIFQPRLPSPRLQFNDSKVPGDMFAAIMTAASRVPGEVTAEFLLKAVRHDAAGWSMADKDQKRHCHTCPNLCFDVTLCPKPLTAIRTPCLDK